MIAKFDDTLFFKEMQNIVDYSIGFLDGAKQGKQKMLENLGASAIEALRQYVDASARVDPAMLHHVYEWNQVGSPNGRLFDLIYTVNGSGLSIKSSFRQSSSVKDGSRTPFYDKASIMENGISVTIKAKKSWVLSFDDNGEQVFTRNPITVEKPGGDVAGNYEEAFDNFINRYFTQVFLDSSGMAKYLKNPEVFKKNLSLGKRGGRSAGTSTGYRWIINAGVVK